MKKLTVMMVIAVAASLALAPAALAQQGGGQQTFQANLTPQNSSTASGTATLALNGDQLDVNISSQGLTPNLPHAQHIHGMAQAISECPTGLALDQNGDGLLSTPEGQPAYGPILVSFTTTGDTSPMSGTAVDRMPKAGADGTLAYSRTLSVPADVAANLGNFAIVQHGIDVDGSGKYDGAPSDLKPELPLEGTLPTNCGKIVPVAATANLPTTGGPSLLLPVSVAMLLGSGLVLGLVGVRRWRLS